MNWIDYTGHNVILENKYLKIIYEYTDIDQFPKDIYGFIYRIDYTDETSYIGKKQLYSYRKIHKLKNGNWPKGTIDVTETQKNTGKGGRITIYTGKFESDWKTYQGSHVDCKNKEIKEKFILALAKTSLELTYLEMKYQCVFDVLANKHFLNDNILGRFYRSNFYVK